MSIKHTNFSFEFLYLGVMGKTMAKMKTSHICYKGLCALALFVDTFSILPYSPPTSPFYASISTQFFTGQVLL